MTKYEIAMELLAKGEEATMKVFGRSMEPIIYTGSKLTFKPFDEYEVDDVVFSKVKGKFIDAHKVTKIRDKGKKKEYMIGNNHGWENGWTTIIYGKVINIEALGK
jgi:signal peptidase I